MGEPLNSFKELKKDISQNRERIAQLIQNLSGYFVGKREIIEVIALSMATQEPLLLVGEPGTGKSDLVVKFCEALGLEEGEYFEYMLTRFTEPGEIIGPVDIDGLKKGKYCRKTEGKLPQAKVAFLDEIFQSNSAILNTLLTLINERKFYQDGKALPVKLKMLFGATNEIPPHRELGALKDRFPLKIKSSSVHTTHFDELIQKGVSNEMRSVFAQKPWVGTGSLDDFINLKSYMDFLIFGLAEGKSGPEGVQEDCKHYWDPRVYNLFRRILGALAKDFRIPITDRKVIKLYRLIRTRAFLLHGGTVRKEDLTLLRYIGEEQDQFHKLEEGVNNMLSM